MHRVLAGCYFPPVVPGQVDGTYNKLETITKFRNSQFHSHNENMFMSKPRALSKAEDITQHIQNSKDTCSFWRKLQRWHQIIHFLFCFSDGPPGLSISS